MNRLNRTVAGLDVHKDSVFLCIMDASGKIFESKYGVLTPDLNKMASDMQRYGVSEVAIARKMLVAIWHMFTKDQEYIDILKIVS